MLRLIVQPHMGQVERSIAVVDIERPETATRIASVRSASLEIEIDDEDEFSHDGPAVDLDELRRQEINQYPVLDNIYYWKFSAEVFCGQLALRALAEKLDLDILPDNNRERVNKLLQKDHPRSLLNEFNRELKNRKNKAVKKILKYLFSFIDSNNFIFIYQKIIIKRDWEN